MAKSALAREEREEFDPTPLLKPGPKPFALHLAERTQRQQVRQPGGGEVFDDPTTVDYTSQHYPEDPHTDSY